MKCWITIVHYELSAIKSFSVFSFKEMFMRYIEGVEIKQLAATLKLLGDEFESWSNLFLLLLCQMHGINKGNALDKSCNLLSPKQLLSVDVKTWNHALYYQDLVQMKTK